ncbi:hypothetical protein HanXRQr2_Chr16g0740561 [Helianthus annuus]|uniref:Uncharacterized protein n=1 Tax=Helianthus annuus TaxID=4232 RepID=A0A9K3DRJ4_HELAN|nr:hypothetical protein HanXRQr2_Chr16g0740561 [Helianthus annuus]
MISKFVLIPANRHPKEPVTSAINRTDLRNGKTRPLLQNRINRKINKNGNFLLFLVSSLFKYWLRGTYVLFGTDFGVYFAG